MALRKYTPDISALPKATNKCGAKVAIELIEHHYDTEYGYVERASHTNLASGRIQYYYTAHCLNGKSKIFMSIKACIEYMEGEYNNAEKTETR